MKALAMYPLQVRVKRCGFNAKGFGYPTLRAGLAENAVQLSRFIDAIDADVVHVVAHSLGGLVTMHAQQLHPDPRIQRIVLLGSPVSGSLSGRRIAALRAGRLLLGNSTRIWEAQSMQTAPDGVAVGIIAGSMPIGLGRLLGTLQRPHDGVVTVAETQVNDATDVVVVPVTHTGLLFSGGVARQACSFLRNARFDHGASS
jgi:pimeloyl-ACP methyl ester carboxylesterase